MPPVGRWTHAHERDTVAARVFVGPGVRLGLSRGRRVLDLAADGAFVDSGPGPVDKTRSRSGRYTVEDGTLVLRYEDGSEQRLRFETTPDGALLLLR